MKNRFLLLLGIFLSLQAAANNMLVQNVTTTGNNAAAKTIQVQFDLSWDNSWRDGINWDAAWIFIKFKDANGLWQHAQLNQTGFANGSGTANTVKVTSDKVGCWVYRSALGSGTFNATGMQLQWNYGLSGLNDVTGLEVRVFSTEMVYVPEGEFNCAGDNNSYGRFYSDIYIRLASYVGNPVISQKTTPPLALQSSYDSPLFRIKGDAGIDFDNDGLIDNTTFPTGYRPFYVMKYELTEQQYTDMLNTCDSSTKEKIRPEYNYNYTYLNNSIFFSVETFYTSNPNRAYNGFNSKRYQALKNWYCLREITQTEMNKLSFGPLAPFNISGSNPLSSVGSIANNQTTFSNSGATYYGVQDIGGNLTEPVIPVKEKNFIPINGNGNPTISSKEYINGKRRIRLNSDVSSSTYSSGLVNGSGGLNLCNPGLQKGTTEIILSGINTQNYSYVSLSYIASKNCYSGKISIFWSANGLDWTPISYSDVTPTEICYSGDLGSYSWQKINGGINILLPVAAGNTSNLRIKWRFEDLPDYNYYNNSNGTYSYYRMDDVTVLGGNQEWGPFNTLLFTNFESNGISDIPFIQFSGLGVDYYQTKFELVNSNIINCCSNSGADYSGYNYSTDGFRYCRSAE